jgi:putative ABC transport system substrate-binding protein
MRRRDFIVAASAAIALVRSSALAQQSDRVRRVALLIGAAQDRDGLAMVAEFRRTMRKLGWIESRNVTIDVFWSEGDQAHVQKQSDAVLKSDPEVIFTYSVRTLTALSQRTKSVPIIFLATSDPVGLGFVRSLAQPGGNLTGFTLFDYAMVGKMLQALKQVAPKVTRVALLHAPHNASAKGYLDFLNSIAAQFGVTPVPAPVRNVAEIGSAMASLASNPGGGLLVPPDVTAQVNRDFVVAEAAKYKLPAIYANGSFAAVGGLMSYGVDLNDLFHRSAGYVDRILRGEKAADLPVQQPLKVVTILNKKTAELLGLEVPSTLLVAADEVID